MIRPFEPTKIGSIFLPDGSYATGRRAEQSQGKRAKSSHRGTVLAMGAPALSKKGIEIPPGFEVGDEVQYVYVHNQQEFTKEWIDGGVCTWVPQECVIAVHQRKEVLAETGT